MIQTQTFALDEKTRRRLVALSKLIARHRNNPERVKRLLAQHDSIITRAPTKLYP